MIGSMEARETTFAYAGNLVIGGRLLELIGYEEEDV